MNAVTAATVIHSYLAPSFQHCCTDLMASATLLLVETGLISVWQPHNTRRGREKRRFMSDMVVNGLQTTKYYSVKQSTDSSLI